MTDQQIAHKFVTWCAQRNIKINRETKDAFLYGVTTGVQAEKDLNKKPPSALFTAHVYGTGK